MPALPTRRNHSISCLFVSLLFSSAFVSNAVSAETASDTSMARAFARRVLLRAGSPTLVGLSMRSITGISGGETEESKAMLTRAFTEAGVRIVKPEQAQATIEVTLSRDALGGLWVARIERKGAEDVVMERVAKRPGAGTSRTSPLTLQRRFLWSQGGDETLLDAALVDAEKADSALLVLSSNALSLYKLRNGGWELEQRENFPRLKQWPQDARGRVMARRDHGFEVHLPGMHCSGTAERGWKMECHESDDPWPLGGVNDGLRGSFGVRNSFTGAPADGSAKGRTVPPFFSAAAVEDGAWVAAGIDGRTRIITQENISPLEGAQDWGSEIAGIRTGCGSFVLAARNGDFTQSDAVRAYAVSANAAAPVSPPIEFNGPILEMWTTADGSSVTVISRNLNSGDYEATLLTLACR